MVRIWILIGVLIAAGVASTIVGRGEDLDGIGLADQQDLVPSVDYVPGELIITFSKGNQPDEHDIDYENCEMDIHSVDALFDSWQVNLIRKLIPTFNRATSEAGSFLERTYVIEYPATSDALAVRQSFANLGDLPRIIVPLLTSYSS